MSQFITPNDNPIPTTGMVSFSMLRNTFGNANFVDTARFSASDLKPDTGLSLSQPATNLNTAFFRGKKLPDVDEADLNPDFTGITETASYETVDTTFTPGSDFRFQKRIVRSRTKATNEKVVEVPVAKRGIGRLISAVMKSTTLSLSNNHTALLPTASTFVSEVVPVTVQVRKRNLMVKTINQSVNLADHVVPMRVKFNIATTTSHTGISGNHHTHAPSHVNTPYSGRHHGRHLRVHRRKAGHQMKRRNHYHQNVHQHAFSGTHNTQSTVHHHAAHSFQYKWARYDGVQFTQVNSDVSSSSFQYHLNQISGCYTNFTPNHATTRTNVSAAGCVSGSAASQCTSASPHSRAACTTTFHVNVRPSWTVTNIPGSKAVSLDNLG